MAKELDLSSAIEAIFVNHRKTENVSYSETVLSRRSESVLHQLMNNCSPVVATFHQGYNGDDLVP